MLPVDQLLGDGMIPAMTNRRVLALLNAAMVDLTADGVAIGLAVGDEVDFLCRGVRAGENVDTSTIFYGASVTKQIVGVLLARAVVARAVDIDDSVRRWLPELPEWTGSVRLGHLVHHTSQLPDVTAFALDVPVSNTEVIERFRRLPSGQSPRPGAGYSDRNGNADRSRNDRSGDRHREPIRLRNGDHKTIRYRTSRTDSFAQKVRRDRSAYEITDA